MANEISEKKQPPTPVSDDDSLTPTDAGDDNPASSSSSKPVHTLEDKMQKNAKQNSQRKLGNKCIGPLRANPPPRLCNRAGSAWNEDPYPCECEKWPKWISEAPPALCKEKKQGQRRMAALLTLKKFMQRMSLWRIGGQEATACRKTFITTVC